MSGPVDAPFSIPQAHGLIGDLFRPRPVVYWCDFLASWIVGASAFVAVGWCAWPAAALPFAISCLALYRAIIFIHELAHLPRGASDRFRLAWNLLCGIPCLFPSFLYGAHHVHHRVSRYGSPEDGEYLAWARRPATGIVHYLAQALLAPALLVTRFLVLAPLSWSSARAAALVRRHASSLVVNPAFVREAPAPEELREWRWLEVGCFTAVLVMIVMTSTGAFSLVRILQGYLTGATIAMLNALRTLAAHRYRHGDGGVSPVEQVLDSVNHPRAAWLTELWAPVGLRFHALHHLFSSLPYHALPAAHRRLMTGLPATSPYRLTESPGLWVSLRRLWREARASSRRPFGVAHVASPAVTGARVAPPRHRGDRS